ncbi:MAG TPA: LuxR family transcriptional regulator, partial [Ktedonobacteraceae bacterium]|nr:LuxR family transcriptional regulator [Ktedonobacteraceae bacterium]
KLSPPRPTANLVARERLLEQMNQALVHDLTLLSASAGSGKTTLLSAWVADCPALVAWLSLEQQDNDLLRFWSYLFAALRTIEPQGGAIAMSMLQSPQPSALTTILTALINQLASSEQQIVLVLDDFHVIEHPAILSSFQFFLEHLPAPVHLVLAGRTDPHLSLSRLRAHGQVCEIRQRDLRFTQDEATSFLTQTMGILLSEDEVALLDQRAEGWIAGLQLAALASRTRETPSAFIRQLSGSQRYILEYLQEEVLERQPADWQAFLLHTSILERLNAPLCQAVTAEENVQTCQQRLEQLERANLFLTPLDEGCQWYRFHSLFRDVLQARLQVVSPELVPLLHQRAARWYAHKGHTFEAVEHALTGADFAFAAELMECAARQMWNNGEAEHLAAWLQRLPDTEFLVHGRLVLTTALQLLYQTFYAANEQWMSMVRQTERTIARLARLLGNQPAASLSETEKQLLRKRLELLRGCIALKEAFRLHDSAEVRRLSAQMQEMSRDEELIWRMVTTFVLRMDPPENWLQLLSELKQQAEQEGDLYEAIWITDILCDAYEQAGQLHDVHQNYIEVLRRLEQIGKAYALFGYPHLQLAHVYGEWNQRAEAHAHLQT